MFEGDICTECRQKQTTTEGTSQVSYESQYIPKSVIDDIRSEIQYEADNKAESKYMMAYYRCLQIIDKYKGK